MSKLQLAYPLYPYYLNQSFGESTACTEDTVGVPITKRKVTVKVNNVCPVGYVELYPLLGMKGHTGADLLASHGQPLYHCGPDSIVEEIQTEPERGLGLGLVSNDSFEVAGGIYQVKIRYWHLMNFNVKLGDTVKKGQLIGHCDNTGLSSGDHLHLELKPVAKDTKYYNVFQSNGYYGSIDPVQFFDGQYAAPLSNLFLRDMRFGESSEDVRRLQAFLAEQGLFKHDLTGFYGKITEAAVYAFQIDHVQMSFWEMVVLKGSKVGPKTRAKINSLL